MKARLTLSCTALMVALTVCVAITLDSNMLAAKPAKGFEVQTLKSRDASGRISIADLRRQESNSRMHVTSIQDTVYSENFDTGAPGWTFQDLWSESFWHVSTTGAYSGKSYWCGIEELGGYANDWQQTLTSPSISLSGATAPVLSFMHHYRGEPRSGGYPSGFDAWDAMTVRLSTDNMNFVVVAPTGGSAYHATSAYGFNERFATGVAGWAGNSGGWVAASFDLTPYAGKTVQIQFLFGSDEGFSHQDDATLFGWRVDDIKIVDGATTIFEDNAGDTGTAQFVAGGPGGPNPWHLTTSAAVSAPNSAGCFDVATGNYLPGMKAGLVSPAIGTNALPRDALELTADFQIQGALDPTARAGGGLNVDVVGVEVRRYSGGVWSYWSGISSAILYDHKLWLLQIKSMVCHSDRFHT